MNIQKGLGINNTMKKTNSGFTIIELLIAMAVVAILTLIAVPSFNDLIDSTARRTQLASIGGDLRNAREVGLGRSRDAVICSSINGTACNGNTDWSSGWIVFLDRNGNQVPDYGTNTCALDEDCLISSQAALTQQITLNADNNFVVFSKLGERDAGASTFRLCSEKALAVNDVDDSHTISIAASGFVAVTGGAAVCP